MQSRPNRSEVPQIRSNLGGLPEFKKRTSAFFQEKPILEINVVWEAMSEQ